MTEYTQGSCLCKAVTYTISGPIGRTFFCHCSLCRKQTGLYYATVSASENDVSIENSDNIQWYIDTNQAQRGFCKTCGSVLFWKSSQPAKEAYLAIAAGSLDQNADFKDPVHIHCASKGSFYTLDDNIPKFDEYLY